MVTRSLGAGRVRSAKLVGMTVEPNPPRGDLVRASHTEREAVLAILHDAYAQGRITVDEFGERSEIATVARTVGELKAVVSDLPVDFMQSGLEPVTNGIDVVEWKGSLSSLKRKGSWQVPRRIVIQRRFGSVELDFTEAQFTSDVVDIELTIVGGSLEMRVPEGASVSIDEVEVVGGSVEDHRKGAVASGRPHIRLGGTLRWGSIEVRGPRKRIFG